MKRYQNVALALCIVCLATICCISILRPMRFERQKTARENEIKASLIAIRNAENAYLAQNGVFCNSLDTLVAQGLLDKKALQLSFTDKPLFHLVVKQEKNASGAERSVMECSANFLDYLAGMNQQQIISLYENAATSGEFPGLKIGDLIEFNDNAGNWE